MLKLYNTLSKQIEELPKKDHLNLYTCGPTVYNYAHIGNLRSYILADLLYRTLKLDGYNPKWVMNITDIDDKTIKGTIEKFGPKANVENLREFTEFYMVEFFKDLGQVNVLKDEIKFVRVTDVIPQIQEFIVKLMDKGYAYKAEDGSTYFSIEKYQSDPKLGDYGELVGKKFLEGKKIGARVKVDEYDKDNLSDFALWKAWNEADAQIYWDHPVLGKGRPGWHIECSVINDVAFKGEPTDIHTGGVDLIFPHHTNEVAQSQALLGKGNFVRHWFHSEHLLVDGKKMSKSSGNFYTLRELEERKKDLDIGIDLRYYFLNSHYRVQQNFVFDGGLESVEIFLRRLSEMVREKDVNLNKNLEKSFQNLFTQYINNDLDFAQGQREIFNILHAFDVDKLDEFGQALSSFKKVLGLKLFEPTIEKLYINKNDSSFPILVEKFHAGRSILIPEEVINILANRYEVRKLKNYLESDRLRKQIEDLGYEVMDTPEGQKVKKKLQI